MSRFSALLTSASLRHSMLAGFALLLAGTAPAQTPTIISYTPNGGGAGTTISIVGTNLGTTTSVLLGGQFMPIVSKSATLLTARIPATASTGKFRITTPTGTVLSSTTLYATRASSSGSTTQVTSNFNGIDVGNYSTPTVADLDNDGLVDLLVGTETGTIIRYEQTSANSTTFGTPGTALTAGGSAIDVGDFAKPTVTDLDGDGLLDLLVGEGTGTVRRYEQTGANALTFTDLGVLTAGGSTINVGNYARPTVADIDGDGFLDLLVGATAGNVAWYEQSAVNGGTFISRGLLTTNGTTTIDAGDVSKPLIIDMDGDGYLDMLVGNQAGNIQRYEQTAVNGTSFAFVGNLTAGGATLDVGGYAAPALADLDGDGYLDLLVGNDGGVIYQFEQSIAAPTTLPVVLTSFTGQASGGGVQLRWTTAQEKNSAAFFVERSINGKNFTTVGEVAAAGNSTVVRNYQLLDAAAEATGSSTRYYRLRQVDQDGTTEYSSIVVVTVPNTKAAVALSAYPNPFTDELSVALPAGAEPQTVSAVLTTLTGQPVYSAQLQLQAAPQRLSGLPGLAPGIYVLRLSSAAGTTTQRISHR